MRLYVCHNPTVNSPSYVKSCVGKFPTDMVPTTWKTDLIRMLDNNTMTYNKITIGEFLVSQISSQDINDQFVVHDYAHYHAPPLVLQLHHMPLYQQHQLLLLLLSHYHCCHHHLDCNHLKLLLHDQQTSCSKIAFQMKQLNSTNDYLYSFMID